MNRKRVKRECVNCGSAIYVQPSKAKRYARQFCDAVCYAEWVRTQPPENQNAYKGIRKPGESRQVYHRRYCANHPENIKHLKARRYARERNAEGSHTLEEWQALCAEFDNACAKCGLSKPLTKDHIAPLSKGGTDYIENIQPLCRSCNSLKWAF